MTNHKINLTLNNTNAYKNPFS